MIARLIEALMKMIVKMNKLDRINCEINDSQKFNQLFEYNQSLSVIEAMFRLFRGKCSDSQAESPMQSRQLEIWSFPNILIVEFPVKFGQYYLNVTTADTTCFGWDRIGRRVWSDL